MVIMRNGWLAGCHVGGRDAKSLCLGGNGIEKKRGKEVDKFLE